MITIQNNPFDIIINIVKSKYPGVNAEIYFVDDLKDDKDEEVCGVIVIPTEKKDEGKPYEILISSEINMQGVVEVLAHELSHAIIGADCAEDHGPEWEEKFNWIHEEYVKKMQELVEQCNDRFAYTSEEEEENSETQVHNFLM